MTPPSPARTHQLQQQPQQQWQQHPRRRVGVYPCIYERHHVVNHAFTLTLCSSSPPNDAVVLLPHSHRVPSLVRLLMTRGFAPRPFYESYRAIGALPRAIVSHIVFVFAISLICIFNRRLKMEMSLTLNRTLYERKNWGI